MKQIRLLPLLLLLAALAVLSLSGCGEQPATHEHRYGDWYVVTPATHTAEGLEARNCTACEEKETRTVPATGHTFPTDWDYNADVHFHTCPCGVTDERSAHTFDSDGVCTVCRVDRSRLAYTKSGGTVTLGTYPQSRVEDPELATSLTAAAGSPPTAADPGAWRPYDDCAADGTDHRFMWYIDLPLGSERYRGVYFTGYRPMSPDLPSAEAYSEQDDNGYEKGTVYWFRYDPIRWRILTRSSGKVLLLADLVLDAVPYQDSCREALLPNPDYREGKDSDAKKNLLYTVTDANGAPDATNANSYVYSRIRRFLLDEFSRTAFTDEQTALLCAVSTPAGGRSIPLTSAGAGDRVFVPDLQDILSFCGTADAQFRRGSDYAACRGLRLLRGDNRFAGGAYWFLRTPKKNGYPFNSSELNRELTASVCMVMATGNRNLDPTLSTTRVDYSFVGTVPAVWLTLAEAD